MKDKTSEKKENESYALSPDRKVVGVPAFASTTADETLRRADSRCRLDGFSTNKTKHKQMQNHNKIINFADSFPVKQKRHNLEDTRSEHGGRE